MLLNIKKENNKYIILDISHNYYDFVINCTDFILINLNFIKNKKHGKFYYSQLVNQ